MRDAYRALFPDDPSTVFKAGMGSLNWPDSTINNLRELLRNASATNADEANELDLLRCKIELRALKDRNDAALPRVRSCFEAYIAQPRPPALLSEARGWIARVDFLSGKGSSASKFYMDELASATSNIRRERLLVSLQQIQPTESDLDGYFDTPAHALFAVNQITSSRSPSIEAALIDRLQKHADLFVQGKDSDSLALAMMRTALRMGAPDAALQYTGRIPASSAVRMNGEYNWLAAIAHYQRKDYAAAETALNAALTTSDTDARLQALASEALVAVYAKLDRPVDQLWAAFHVAKFVVDAVPGQYGAERVPVYPEFFYELLTNDLLGNNFDASYLLDVQMTDAQLEEYLQRYPGENIPFIRFGRNLSSQDAVRYALAVRYSRREAYEAALKIFEELGEGGRSFTVRRAAALLTAARSPNTRGEQRLEALYNYADFLVDNEDHVFFNDTLWSGYQSYAFLSRDPDDPGSIVGAAGTETQGELNRIKQLERQLRDDQEEYWKAYQILNQVVEQSGSTELRRKAATRALLCLRRIRTDRFGRKDEIRAADLRLTRLLGQQQ